MVTDLQLTETALRLVQDHLGELVHPDYEAAD